MSLASAAPCSERAALMPLIARQSNSTPPPAEGNLALLIPGPAMQGAPAPPSVGELRYWTRPPAAGAAEERFTAGRVARAYLAAYEGRHPRRGDATARGERRERLIPVAIFFAARYRRDADGCSSATVEEVLFTRTVLSRPPATPLDRDHLRRPPACARARDVGHGAGGPHRAVALHALWGSVTSGYALGPIAAVSFGLLIWRLRAATARIPR
jgi:hypothetical protein